MKALIVEDSPTQAVRLNNILKANQYQTQVVNNGQEALDILAEFQPDLIISDIVMPIMNGYELCKRIRMNDSFKHLAVILLSTLSDIEDIISGLESGANYIITKPYQEEYLLKHLKTAIDLQKLRQLDMEDDNVKVLVDSKEYIINSKKSQIVDFLISVYAAAIQKNKELYDTRLQLQELNNKLEKKVEERTAALRIESEEKKRYEQQFFEAQKLESIGQLTGGIAHDFNNLLLIAEGNLEMLASNLAANSQEMQYLEQALTALQRGSDLTKHLLSFARKQALFPKSIPVKLHLVNIITLLKSTLKETINIITSYENNIWQIWVDPMQFENAIMNIVINARDAMLKGGEINFNIQNVVISKKEIAMDELIQLGDYVKISISDQGEGMPPEVMKRIFEPFFTTKEVGAGTGLGLSMVYGFIKQSNGHISVESKVGLGTTFHLYLPRSTVLRNNQIEEKKFNYTSLEGKEVILIAEDEIAILKLVSTYLKKLGYQILTASTGDEALEVIKSKQKIDLLFSDVIMPGVIKGTELAVEARKIIPEIKILFTSGYTKDALLNSNLSMEDIQHISKPYKLEDLAIKLRSILDVTVTSS